PETFRIRRGTLVEPRVAGIGTFAERCRRRKAPILLQQGLERLLTIRHLVSSSCDSTSRRRRTHPRRRTRPQGTKRAPTRDRGGAKGRKVRSEGRPGTGEARSTRVKGPATGLRVEPGGLCRYLFRLSDKGLLTSIQPRGSGRDPKFDNPEAVQTWPGS